MPQRLLPLREVCELIAAAAADVLAWVASGAFPAPVVLPNGRPRWRACDVAAWERSLGRAVVEDGPEETPATPLERVEDLPDLCQDMFQALVEAKGAWLNAPEMGRKIGVADTTSGNWNKAIARLKRAVPQIQSHRRKGYRLPPDFFLEEENRTESGTNELDDSC